jgi:hypothetical protein
MSDPKKKVHVAIPPNWATMTPEQQNAALSDMATALQRGLGVPEDKVGPKKPR